jgi:hypothetical protein
MPVGTAWTSTAVHSPRISLEPPTGHPAQAEPVRIIEGGFFERVAMSLVDADCPASSFLPVFILEKDILLPGVTFDVSFREDRQTPFLSLNPA